MKIAAAIPMLLVLGAGCVAAGVAHAGGSSPVRLAWPGYGPAYPLIYPTYLTPGACLPAGACANAWWTDRYLPRRPVAPDQPDMAVQDIWGSTGSPWGYVRRLPPPTPRSQIQPRYQDASTVRPEFAEP